MRDFKKERTQINHLLMEAEDSIDNEEELEYILSNIKERYLFEQREVLSGSKIHHRIYGDGVVISQEPDNKIKVEFKRHTVITRKGNINIIT